MTQAIGMQIASGPQAVGMQLASAPKAIDMGVVIALTVVDMDAYVKKEDLQKMHVMTWGNELQEGDNNA